MTTKELSKSTTTQSKIPRSAPMLCSSTNQNQLTLLDKRHYGGKVSHPKVDLIANPIRVQPQNDLEKGQKKGKKPLRLWPTAFGHNLKGIL